MNTSTFHRDEFTSALLNTDEAAIKSYKTRQENLKKIQQMEQEVNSIKHELINIKDMLQQILTKV
jgi:prefoldin subunit 5